MNEKSRFRTAALAASIALAMGNTAAMAADPAATQLPGRGTVTAGTATAGDIANGAQTIDITGPAVINWGNGSAINPDGTGGFNIGADASLTFHGMSVSGTSDGVLNVDSSGNASQIFGALNGTSTNNNAMNIFVANPNGVIVGADATIVSTASSQIGLVGHTALDTAAFDGNDGSLAFDGAGGDVVVQKGASIGAGSPLAAVLVAGGNTVNVDLSAFKSGAVTLNAGGYDYNQNGGPASTYNDAASMSIAGSFDGASIDRVVSGGDVSNSGTLDFSGRGDADTLSVAGTFTNTGSLTLIDGMTLDGAMVNEATVNAEGVTLGGLTNDGQFNATGNVDIAGDFANTGAFTSTGIAVTDGDFTNMGEITQAGDVSVENGSIVNNGTMRGVGNLETSSDMDSGGYEAGADYSITNAGLIESLGGEIMANVHPADSDDDSTGSFVNTGMLQLGGSLALVPTAPYLYIQANDDVNLGGTVQVMNTAGEFAAVSPDNALAAVDLEATNGNLTVSTPIAFQDSGESYLMGQKVKLMADITGADDSLLIVAAGDKAADDYAIRVANGVTVSAGDLYVGGLTGDMHPDVILQGKLAANTLFLGGSYLDDDYSVSDVYSGPDGGLVATGDAPTVGISFTGGIKAAPYLNGGNFRYNYLPIGMTADAEAPLQLTLDPVMYETNGTSNGMSAVNVLVDGDVDLLASPTLADAQVINGTASAVTGVSDIPNTHLVLQSTGNISTDASGYYWPGYVYLGTIDSAADGSAAPGTLGMGTISVGNFSNVLPGSLDNGGGIHFITQWPLNMAAGTEITTNANSWVNFGSDLMTQAYASGALGDGTFFGGSQGPGNVVNYGELDPSMFHTHAPVATR